MNGQRIYFLDNLRTGIILLVVVFHAAMAYMVYVPEWWYVIDTERALSADIFVIWADIFIMPVMFFIAGYFAVQSLARHSTGDFWRAKGLRIGIPWVAGSMLLAPPIAYIMIASRSIPMSFEDFYFKLFWGPAYQQSQYWFLGALMALYLLLWLVCRGFPSLRRSRGSHTPGISFLLAAGLLGAISVGAVNAVCADSVWIHPLYLLVLQPVRVPLYLLYFALGVYAWRNGWLRQDGWVPAFAPWTLAFAILSVLYVGSRLVLPLFWQPSPLQYLLVNSLLHSFFCLTAVFALLAIFQRSLSFTNTWLTSLAAAAYPIYFLHQLFVQLLNWLVRPLPVGAFLKYAIVCSCALTVCYLLSRYVLLRWRCFRG